MQPYIREKQEKRKKLIFKLKLYGSFIFLFLSIIGITYVIIYSSLFQIKDINRGILKGDVKDFDKTVFNLKFFFATNSKISSILGADNILIWKNQAKDFIKYQPTISDLTIKKDYLNKIISINIDSRQKFGALCSNVNLNIECWWFDENGIIFKEAPQIEGEIIYKINDLSGKKFKIGEMALPQNLFDNVIKIFKVLEEIKLSVKTLNIYSLELQEGYIESPLMPKIYFSLRFAPNFNNAIFQNLKEIGLQKIEYIDLRIENRVYYKTK